MEKAYEIKVLTGVHAGAKARLPSGRVVVGSAEDCDIVLAVDDVMGHHAELLIDDQGVAVAPLEGEVVRADGTLVTGRESLPAFTPIGFGGAVVATAQEGATWPRIDLADFGRRRPDDAGAVPSAPSIAGAEVAARPPVSAATPAVRRRTGVATRAAAVGALLGRFKLYPVIALLLVGIGYIATIWFTGGGGAAVTRPPSEAEAVAPPSPVEQVSAALAELGLAEGLDVRAVGERVVLVTGYVELSRQKATLSEDVKVEGADVVYRVWAQEDLLRQARQRLAELAPGLEVTAAGPGEVRLRGYVADPDRRSRIVAAVSEDVPGIRSVVDDILTQPEAEQALRAAVAQSPLAGRVTLDVAHGEVVAHGVLGEEDLRVWADLMAAFRDRYGGEVPVRTAFVPRAQDLPFTLRAVVAGPTRFVVTANGRRVAEGGDLGGGFILEAVGDGEVTIRRGEEVFVQRFRE